MYISCAKCRRLLHDEDYLEVETEERMLRFCIKCIRSGFDTLGRKKTKTPDEISLLSGFRGFLKEKKILHEA